MILEGPAVWLFASVAFAWGLAVGSFANVAIYRVPAGLSVVRPRSSCPRCSTPIAWYDNIPILSFVLLGGKCRHCKEPISIRYPIVELAVAALFTATAFRFGVRAELPAFLIFTAALVMLSAIDLEHRRLPNKILGPASIIAIALFSVGAFSTGRWESLRDSLLGAAVYGLPMFALALLYPKGMGLGDVKFAGYLGFHLGWLGLTHVLVGAVAGFLSGGLTGTILLASGRSGRKDPIPFGPFMAFGALLAVFLGRPILRLWLG